MSTHDHHSFMPPDEPTAVYPIGASKEAAEKESSLLGPEPPEPPELSLDALEELDDSSGFNPMIAVALLGIPLVLGVGTVILAGLLLSL